MTPVTFVVFGSTGNLAQTRIMPTLARLMKAGTLPVGSRVVAFSRRSWDDAAYREFIRPSLATSIGDTPAIERFLESITHISGELDDPAAYGRLAKIVGTSQSFFHCAVHSDFYATIAERLGAAHLCGTILFEKPFGNDLLSAQMLEETIFKSFTCGQVFRIDHYLGKPALDAFVAERQSLLESHVNGTMRIRRVACRVVDTQTIDGRGEFYDSVGALRDVGQNHALEMLAHVLMDTPAADARAEVLEQLTVQCVEHGQYEGYRLAEGVGVSSNTETYFRVKLASSHPQWVGVELVIEGGKAFDMKRNEIVVEYEDGRIACVDIEKTSTPRDAYDVIVQAALENSADRFVSSREIMASWRISDQARILFEKRPLVAYPQGSPFPPNNQ